MEWLHLTCLTIYQSTSHLMFLCAVVLPGRLPPGRLPPGLKDMIIAFSHIVSATGIFWTAILNLCILFVNSKTKYASFFTQKGILFHKLRDKYGIKLLTKIRVNFSDLRDHRYYHNLNCQNPSCAFGLEDETTVHYFLCCPCYCQLRTIYLSRISDILGSDITVLPNEHLSHILIYGSNVYNVTNELIVSETIPFIKQSQRFQSSNIVPIPQTNAYP